MLMCGRLKHILFPVIGLFLIFILLLSFVACVRLNTRELPENTPPLMTEAEFAAFKTKYDTIGNQLALKEQKENKAKTLLISSGLPVAFMFIEQIDKSNQILMVVLNYDKLSVGSSEGAFITAAVQSLVKVAGVKTLDLSGITYVTSALQDSKGNVFFEAAAKAADVDSFRTGKLTQTQLIKRIAAKVTDRFAAWGARK